MAEPGGASAFHKGRFSIDERAAIRKKFSFNERKAARWCVEFFEDPARHFPQDGELFFWPENIRRTFLKLGLLQERGQGSPDFRFDRCLFRVIRTAKHIIDTARMSPAQYSSFLSRCTWTPLCTAAEHGWPHIVALFLWCGAEVDQPMFTPLHATLIEAGYVHGERLAGVRERNPCLDHLAVVRMLLHCGADPTLVCAQRSTTPLDVARSRGGDLMEFVELFEADPRVQRRESRRTCAYCEGVASCVQPPFQVCAGCRCVRYCSRDCQKAHWRSGHRADCRASRKSQREIDDLEPKARRFCFSTKG